LFKGRELHRGQGAETAVRPQVVVILPPRLDDRTGFRQAAEQVLVKALVAQLAVERFNECVLHRLAWLDVGAIAESRGLDDGMKKAAYPSA